MRLFPVKQSIVLAAILFVQPSPGLTQNPVNYGYRFIYHDERDTIYFNNFHADGLCLSHSTTIMDSIQIDGKGAKEIIFFRNGSCSISEHGGTFDIDEYTSQSKYEIWNLDTREMVFEVITASNSMFNKFIAYADPQHIKGSVASSCSFNIYPDGRIQISNAKSDSNVHATKWKTIVKNGVEEDILEETPYIYYPMAVKTEGIYRFANGEYVLE